MLADKLTYDWQRIARLLSFNETDLDHLKADFTSTYEQTFQMFNKWQRENPLKKWLDLKNALKYRGRKDLAIACRKRRFR